MDCQENGKILGVNTRHYPTSDGMYHKIAISVVLVAGSVGDYAAYAGHGDPEWIARQGYKVSFDEACIHFPDQLERERYRD